MSVGIVPPWPRRLAELPPIERPPFEDELAALQSALEGGVPVATVVVVPAELEERFYRWNTLPERIMDVFQAVDPTDPDEDDLEELAPRAQALVEEHFLLDEFVDAFYDRISALPARVRVRRPWDEGVVATRGRPALLAVKRLWAADWSLDALVDRLDRTKSFALQARATLVHGADRPAPAHRQEALSALFETEVRAWSADDGGVTRISFDAAGADSGSSVGA